MLKESCKTFIRYVETDTDDDDGEELEVIVNKKTEKKAEPIQQSQPIKKLYTDYLHKTSLERMQNRS